MFGFVGAALLMILLCLPSGSSVEFVKENEEKEQGRYVSNVLMAQCNATFPKVLIVYDSRDGHTRALARSVANGIDSAEGKAESVLKDIDEATYEDVLECSALAIGSPVFYGNPSFGMIRWVEETLGPGWENRTFEERPGAAFATGGGIHQGTESTLGSLTRSLLAFGFSIVTPDVTGSGYAGTLGLGAITGTAPFDEPDGVVSQAFQQAGSDFGHRLASHATRFFSRQCK